MTNNLKKDQAPKIDFSDIEMYKIEIDYLKNLNSLCTGSILIIIAFLEKLFMQPQWKILIAISLCCFVFSILSSLIAKIFVMDNVTERKSQNDLDKVQDMAIGGIYVSFSLFFFGISSLVLFGLINLF